VKSKKELWKSPPAASAVGYLFLFFRKDDSQLIVVEKGGRVRVYETVSGKLIKSLTPNFMAFRGKQPEGIAGADLDPSGRIMVLAGDLFGGIYLVDLDRAMQSANTELKLNDGTYRVQPDSGIAIWERGEEPKTSSLLKTLLSKDDDGVTDVKVDPLGKFIAATTWAGFLKVWRIDLANLASGGSTEISEPVVRKVGDARNKFRSLKGLACSKNLLLTVGYYSQKYGDLQMWTADAVEMIQHFSGADPGTPSYVTFDPTGQYAATTGDVRYVLWRIVNEKVEPIVRIYLGGSEGHDTEPQAVGFSPSDPIVAVADLSGIFFVNIEKMKVVDRIGVSRRTLDILPFEKQPQ
jgi:WD40 repeat protein